jgi:cellulose synthase/poly-beta-1,6-N-acetylglucosamine synthase-like glycosyltransferase
MLKTGRDDAELVSAATTARTPEPEVTVVAEPVMSRGEHATFVTLSVLAIAATLAFTAAWVTTPHIAAYPAAFILATLLVYFHVASWVARWLGMAAMRRPRPMEPEPGLRVAAVTTFVPGAEPVAMLENTLRAMMAMEYPHDCWVLDEGDDPNLRELCSTLGVRHFTRQHEPRYQEHGGRFARRSKHGNHNAWLDAVGYDRYDVVAAFDADHVPERDYLTSLLGYFRDPAIAYVQAPQVYYNQDASFVARAAAEESYTYYSVHQMVSYGLGHPIIVGSHNVQRVAALRAMGGLPDHDADDLLLTHRYRAAGWRGVFVPRILAMGITPTDWFGYLRQQIRWARSIVDLKLRELPRLARELPPVERALGALHGLFYLRGLTIPAAYLLLVYLMLIGGRPALLGARPLVSLAALIVLLGAIGMWRQRFHLDPERERGPFWRALALQFAKWPHFAVAVARGLLGRPTPYAITFKVGSKPGKRFALWPHWLMAAVFADAWLIGRYLHDGVHPVLTAATVILIVISLALAATDALRVPTLFDPSWYRRRRAAMTDLPCAPPV